MRLVEGFVQTMLLVISSSFEADAFKCTLDNLQQCYQHLNENVRLECASALRELPKCIYVTHRCKNAADATKAPVYDDLRKRLSYYKECFQHSSDDACNETLIEDCHGRFRQKAEPFCDQINVLRACVGRSNGCHVMKHPWFALSVSMIKTNSHCFVKNYSAILQVLHGNATTTAQTNTSLVSKKPSVPVCVGLPTVQPSRLAKSPKLLLLCLAAVLTLFVFVAGLLIHKRRHTTKYREVPVNTRTEANCSSSTRQLLSNYVTTTDISRSRSDTSAVELPPPYHSQVVTLHTDLPPPYTSRPSSVNGEFV